ncbi:MAG: peptide chain release factor N(5)-glutamine methyltransferase [Piscinibacter sp.]|uniref:peptide chain release factor N(5)-glutamine methyltransferase n=1 Tax=Piscinibacter sp. TaxID=1903157 RepID=UPI003D0C3B4C
MSTVREAIGAARLAGLDRLDAQLLLGHVIGRDRAWLLAHDDETLPARQQAQFDALVNRRRHGEPVAYLLGEKEFHGLALQVDARVLVPRPDTEVLVDWAVELLRHDLAGIERPSVVDLGTGSGAIALAVKHDCPAATLTASDASADALAMAQANARRLGLAVEWVQGSWWSALPGRKFDLALSNPPYIAAGDAHLGALAAEPIAALTPGPSGLEALREIVAGAGTHLRPRAWLLLEHGFDQGEAVRGLLRSAGFTDVQTRQDLGGQPRCTGGRRQP